MPAPDDRLQILTNRGSDDAYDVPAFTDAANTWIGDWTQVVDWERIVGTLASNQASTASGLIVQQSNDKTNVEDSSTFTNDGSAVTEIDVKVTCSWLRVRFEHNGVIPTAFRYHIFGSTALVDDVAVSVSSGDLEVGGGTAASDAGNSGATVLRVTIATDDVNMAAIKTAIEGTLTATVSATDLDIRALTNTDVVSVEQATHDSLNLNANMQVGDADAAAGAGINGVTVLRVAIATDDVNLAAIKTAIEGTLTVSATDLDIRALTAATDSVDANLQVADADADVGAGNAGASTQRVSISTDDVNLAAIKTALEIIDNLVVAEDEAHSGGESGLIPFSVRQDVLAALSGTTGDRQPLSTDENGALYTREDRRGVLSVSGAQATATSTQIVAAPGANKAIHVVGAMLQQNGATPTAQLVAMEDGTAGTERANFRLSANDGAGATLAFPVTIATNEALKLDSDQAQSFVYTISYRVIDV